MMFNHFNDEAEAVPYLIMEFPIHLMQETVDKSLLRHDGAINVLDQSLVMMIDSKKMEELVLHNFQEEDLTIFLHQSHDKSPVRDRLLNYLDVLSARHIHDNFFSVPLSLSICVEFSFISQSAVIVDLIS